MSLRFKPGADRLICIGCGTDNQTGPVDPVAHAAMIEELDYEAHVRQQLQSEPTIEARLLTCPQCGAQTQFADDIVASVCGFCATPLLSATLQTERRIRPRGVVPFVMDAPRAQRLFKQWIDQRWFAPNALKASVRSMDAIRGVYLPCWTFDAETTSAYEGERGRRYTVTDTSTDAQGKTVKSSRTETDWTSVSGVLARRFDDTLVVASRSLPTSLSPVLRRWDAAGMQPFSQDYLAGFTVEAYQVGLEEGMARAKAHFDSEIREAVRRDIGGDDQRIHALQTHYADLTFKHILLPLWICSYPFDGKTWQVVVNGQTGDIEGDRPWSAWKIGLTVATVLALIGAAAWWVHLR